MYPTNVVKVMPAVKPEASDGTPQLVFYDEGIGTESRLAKLIGGAFGTGIERNIQDCYRFLCLNYEPGDEVYLFGFSRGAYTVRSLAGLIYCSGLVSRVNIRKTVEAYELYRNPKAKPRDPAAVQFRKDFGQEATIRLLACWDTVGSLGVPDRFKRLRLDKFMNRRYSFHDCSLSHIVEYALHAVAVDERRGAFAVTPMQGSSSAKDQVLRQVWFAGNHGAVGGGDPARAGLSDNALEWMLDSIRSLKLGLDLDRELIPSGLSPDHMVTFKNRISVFYWLASGRNIRKITGAFDDLNENAKKRWRDRDDYRPRNLRKAHGAALDGWVG